MELVGRLILGGVLLVAVAAKLARPRQAAAAMAGHGFRTPRSRRLALALVVGAEAALAVGVALGSDDAAYAAAALLTMLALTLGGELLRGRVGEPCGCFGAAGRVGRPAIGRNLLLATAFAALPASEGRPALALGAGLLAGAALALPALARAAAPMRSAPPVATAARRPGATPS